MARVGYDGTVALDTAISMLAGRRETVRYAGP